MDNRRLLIAFLLSMIVIGVWFWLFPPPKPAAPAPPPASQTAQAPAPAQTVPGAPAAQTPAGTPPGAAAAQTPPAPVEAIAAAAEERVELLDGRTRAVFTNRGAQLVSMVVPEKQDPKAGTLEMVRERSAGPYPYALVTKGLQPHPLDNALFRAEKSADGRSVLFRYSGPLGVAEKRFSFNPKGLLEADVRLPGSSDWGLIQGPGVRNPTSEEMKSRFEHRRAVYKLGEEVKQLDPSGAFDPVEVPVRGLVWISLADTYFLSAQIPQGSLDRATLLPVMMETGKDGAAFVPVPPKDQMTKEQKDLPREYELVLRPAGDRLTLVSYWGSKEYERLKALPYGLEGTVEMGKFSFLARPLLVGLHWIYDNVVSNYGWAIILMTVLIKLLLLPITHKSTMSMRKMQELNPKVQSIRDKYRTKLRDKQGKPNLESQRKMNEEVMAVYKEAGVNPAGGCFPLLLQMPILFAFYGLLGSAVDLRKAPWILWIHDLSVHDPYYVLPIIMGVSQFLQVRMGPQAGDPMQRKMFQLMPLVMTFLFLGFPSGLVLYWLTNNVLTIIQAANYFNLDPDWVAYRSLEKRHGFLKTRRKVVIEVDPDNPKRASPVSAPATVRAVPPPPPSGYLTREAPAAAEPPAFTERRPPAAARPEGDRPRPPRESRERRPEGGGRDRGPREGGPRGDRPRRGGDDRRPPRPERRGPEAQPFRLEGGPGEGLVTLPEKPRGVSERYPMAAGPIADAAVKSVELLLRIAGLELKAQVFQGEERLEVDLSGEDVDWCFADDGELIQAVEHLLPRMIRSLSGEAVPVRVDCDNFHEIREERLRSLAQKVAEEVRRQGKPRILEPMNPSDRRMIHVTLADDPGVITESEGDGYFKRIMVRPA